jgi:hypothetical protein
MPERRRTPLNVAGPFYVEADCCITCGAPEAEAPDLIRFDDTHGSCYFHHQPVTPDETFHAIAALNVCCVGALRYAGTNPDILRRLTRLGSANQCDAKPVDAREPTPSIVTFAHATEPSTHPDAAPAIAAHVAESMKGRWPYLSVSPVQAIARGRAKFRYGWSTAGTDRHPTSLTLRAATDGPGRWCMSIHQRGPHLWTPREIHDALATTPGVSDLRWYTKREYTKCEWTAWRRFFRPRRWEQFPF